MTEEARPSYSRDDIQRQVDAVLEARMLSAMTRLHCGAEASTDHEQLAVDESMRLTSMLDMVVRERTAYLDTLVEANDLCRSAFQVANRIATEYSTQELGTAFGAMSERLSESLERQHVILKPELERRAEEVLASAARDRAAMDANPAK